MRDMDYRQRLGGPRLAFATVGFMLATAGGLADAEARNHRTAQRPVAEKRAVPVPPPAALLAIVSISKQRITVYGAQGVLGQSPVSTGRPGHATPTGVFSVLQKNRFHRSNIYSGAPMPFMQRLTWSGIALHAGALPGFPASHGCIRLPANFASDLWGMTRLGARVLVVPDDAAPSEIAHASLPTPKLTPATAGLVPAQVTAELTLAATDGAERTDALRPEPRLLNPIERARASKAALAADAAGKTLDAKAKAAMSATRAKEASQAIAALRLAQRQLADAQARRDWAEKVVAAARTPDATQRASAALAQAQAKLEEVQKAAAGAAEREAAATAESVEAARAAWAAEQEAKAATIAAKSADRASSGDPISIFISRKTKRVQVRQGWDTLHDAPATFKGGEEPLGTHVYVAVAPVGQGEALRWIAVSFKGSGPAPAIKPVHYRRPHKPEPPAPVSQETAQSILEKFEIDEASRQFIAERLWTGATLIVSDQGPSHETSHHTDFVILTR